MTINGKITAMPSPSGRNDARMFIFTAPKGVRPELALDAALKGRGDAKRFRAAMDFILDQDPNNQLAGPLREAFDNEFGSMDQENVSGGEEEQERSSMREANLAAGGKTYGEGEDQEAEWDRDREEEQAGDDTGSGASKMFGAGDRKIAQDRANADWLDELTGRIGNADSLR